MILYLSATTFYARGKKIVFYYSVNCIQLYNGVKCFSEAKEGISVQNTVLGPAILRSTVKRWMFLDEKVTDLVEEL